WPARWGCSSSAPWRWMAPRSTPTPAATARCRTSATKIEAQLKAEVADLLGKAEAADQADVADGMQVPEELARREKRLAEIARAKAGIEAPGEGRPARARGADEAR